jgi:hypothetical protein
MRMLWKITTLLCLLLFFDPKSSISQPIDKEDYVEHVPTEDVSAILPKIQLTANEYRLGSSYAYKRIQRGLGLDDILLIRIGLATDCLQKTKCIYTLVRIKSDQLSFVTPCAPGASNLYDQHRANGDIVSAFEFICTDGSSFVVGISNSSISVNSQLKR